MTDFSDNDNDPAKMADAVVAPSPFDDNVSEGQCELCGEMLPEGERMFKYHGYSGPCPKGPRPRAQRVGIVEYLRGQADDGQFYLQVKFNGADFNILGPFDTQGECDRATEDLLSMMRQCGARDGSALNN